MDKLPCGVLEVSKDRRILYCNCYASKLLGAPSDQLVGQSLESIVSAGSRIFIDCYVYPLMLDLPIVEEVQLTLRGCDGSRIPIVSNIAIEEDDSSLWTFMSCCNRNKLYETLLSTQDSLSDQAGQLKLLNEQVHCEKEDLEVFCQSLSHDFTGPISRCQQMIGFVTADLGSKNLNIDEELEMLDRTVASLNSLMTLVNGLVEFLTTDAHEPHDEIVDLNDIVSVAVSLNEGQNDELFSVTKETLPMVMGSSAQLKVLFKNLVGNAIKYNDNPPEILITCDCHARDGLSVISIKDNGIGISPKYLDRIFEPFTQLHAEGEYSGCGLGLRIVKKLVSKHNGDISVESTPGEGSTFHVSFPIVQINNTHK